MFWLKIKCRDYSKDLFSIIFDIKKKKSIKYRGTEIFA